MSTVQQQNGFSPTSTNNTTTMINNHFLLFDNSDQGSIDSDYTSLGSSKFYGNGGSTSSLHRQGRSQSIDELATSTTNIPTRHFNGILNVNKSNNDPLQFVKIQPNHELTERAQEQLNLLESQKRLQDNLKYAHHHNSIKHLNDDDETNWSKAVENWRQKREQKRKQSLNSNHIEDEPTTPVSALQPSPPPTPVKKNDEPRSTLPPPPPSFSTTVVSTSTKANKPTEQLSTSSQKKAESPTPQRPKGPSRIHEVCIQKPVDVRGFGFKSDGGSASNRPIYISYIEDGSAADKSGLCIDDEIICIDNENVEQMTFDQVRRILTEKNRRGSIKLLVRTFEDGIDDTSQTVTTGHSRTPSPQKTLSTLNKITNVLPTPPPSQPPPPPPPLSSSTPAQTSTIRVSSSTPTNVQSPVYTFLPYTPTSVEKSMSQTPTSSLNIFAPKPFRPTSSTNSETPNSLEKNHTYSSPIEAFRKMLEPSTSISKSMNNEPTDTVVQSRATNQTKPASRDVVNSLLTNPTLISSTIIDPSTPTTNISKSKPPPLSSVESLLHGRSDFDTNDQQRNESPIAQVRTSVEKQMNQLQQELLLGFPHTQTSREQQQQQQPVDIPIDLSKAAISSPYQESNSRHTPNENAMFYYDSNNQQRSSTTTPNHMRRFLSDTPNQNRSSTERSVNELRINISSPSPASYQQQKQVSLPIDEDQPQQRVTNKQLHSTLNQAPKKSQYEDHTWIAEDQRKSLINSVAPPPPSSSTQFSSLNTNQTNHHDRRSASLTPRHHHEIHNEKQLSMFHYGDHIDDNRQHRHHQSRTTQQQQRDIDPSLNRHHQSKHRKSPIRTTINSNNNRVLSVSGKLRCSRCNDELGQGSAMVIESLGLYYHIECFRCFVCNIPLSSSFEGTDVRVRSNRLHCQNCFSDENGAWRSNV